MTVDTLPAHLKRYVVEQNYDRYTTENQAVWRYILRQLMSFLSRKAHSVYLEGLKKTGVPVEHIPNIEKMSERLSAFGWKAIPVSGFIPPAAFMEFQALGYLPIASDMRTIDHLFYTPAPDIVHEAAGHAPIIADEEYADYLKKYADVARHAIISHEDLAVYEAIRDLSDIKEDPDSTPEQIKKCEDHLNDVVSNISFVSEAAVLGRMNWWTAEYGLIGDINDPKIYGAGLLSSVGESRSCFADNVKKIPLTLGCIEYSYDITEKQPQLFVAKDFAHLCEVLEELANTMSFRRGGVFGLERAKQAQNVNTVTLSSGLQISGKLTDIKTTIDEKGEEHAIYIQFTESCQLALNNQELEGHGKSFHLSGYGTALGFIDGIEKAPENLSDSELEQFGLKKGETTHFKFQSGIEIKGELVKCLRNPNNGKSLVWTFDKCHVTHNGETLFDPEWGVYDLALGTEVTSVFGGPADRLKFGAVDDFIAKVIPAKTYNELEVGLHAIYGEIRKIRESFTSLTELETLYNDLKAYPKEWLPRLEILEVLSTIDEEPNWKASLEKELEELKTNYKEQIEDGLKAIEDLPLVYEI